MAEIKYVHFTTEIKSMIYDCLGKEFLTELYSQLYPTQVLVSVSYSGFWVMIFDKYNQKRLFIKK